MVRTRRVAVALAAAGVTAGVLTGVASPVGTASTTGPASTTRPASTAGTVGTAGDPYQAQIRVMQAADLVKAAGGEGFAGLVASDRQGELLLYWKGDLPAPVSRAVAQARRDVQVRVLPAAHTERELIEASDRLAKVPGVTRVGPLPDGSGVTMGYAGDVQVAGALPAVRAAAVPVVVEPGEYVRTTNRQDDFSPFKGGATFLNGSWRCTTGWGVIRIPSSPAEMISRSMLTAGHCGSEGLDVTDGAGSPMGYVARDDDNRDTMLISTASTGAVYLGPWHSSLYRAVRQPIGNYANTLVCASGAVSGQRCGIRVMAVNQRINLRDDQGNTYSAFPMVLAQAEHTPFAVAGGDSGGPVMAQDSWDDPPWSGGGGGGGGVYNVYAAGTITGGSVQVQCSGEMAQPSPCYRVIAYAPLQESLAYYGVTLMASG